MTDPIVLTFDKVAQATRYLTSTNPDFVYLPPNGEGFTCYNAVLQDDGTAVGSCLVGQALIKLGVPAQWLAGDLNRRSSSGDVLHNGHQAGVLVLPDDPEDRRDVFDYLARAQMEQDREKRWADAEASASALITQRHDLRRGGLSE